MKKTYILPEASMLTIASNDIMKTSGEAMELDFSGLDFQ